jgi:predicted amidohydrolase
MDAAADAGARLVAFPELALLRTLVTRLPTSLPAA